MGIIQHFDPWQGKFCTCPPKYTLNPYTGCQHGCLYCYITSFIPRPFIVREKPNLFKSVARELSKLDPLYLSLSNSSDPYPQEEENKEYTRTILKMCKESGFPVLVITKSSLVVRDIDILRAMKATVSLTITTIDPKKAKLLEPNAPPPEARIKTLIRLSQEGIPTVLRLDPIIPGLNDDPEEWEEILNTLHTSVQQVVISTFKPRIDAFQRITQAFPAIASTRSWYSQKEGNSFYLAREKRREILTALREMVHRYGMSFASCREGFPEWNDLHCDGSSLLETQSSSSSSTMGGTSPRG